MPCDIGVPLPRDVKTLLGVQAHAKRLRLDSHLVPGTPTALSSPTRSGSVRCCSTSSATRSSSPSPAPSTSPSPADARRGRTRPRCGITGHRHRHRHRRGQATPAVREVHAGRRVHHPPVRRHWSRPGDLERAWWRASAGRSASRAPVGVGSRFWFTFVAPGGHGRPRRGAHTTVTSWRPRPERRRWPGGLRILVAEDNPSTSGSPCGCSRNSATWPTSPRRPEAVRMAQDPLRGHPDGLPHAGRRWLRGHATDREALSVGAPPTHPRHDRRRRRRRARALPGCRHERLPGQARADAAAERDARSVDLRRRQPPGLTARRCAAP